MPNQKVNPDAIGLANARVGNHSGAILIDIAASPYGFDKLGEYAKKHATLRMY
jgi:hypothetical protein